MTGNKAEKKVYHRHTGYPGGLRTTSYERMMDEHPERILKKAGWGMLPNNRLGRQPVSYTHLTLPTISDV